MCPRYVDDAIFSLLCSLYSFVIPLLFEFFGRMLVASLSLLACNGYLGIFLHISPCTYIIKIVWPLFYASL